MKRIFQILLVVTITLFMIGCSQPTISYDENFNEQSNVNSSDTVPPVTPPESGSSNSGTGDGGSIPPADNGNSGTNPDGGDRKSVV